MISLSTAWLGPERPTVEKTIADAADLGFRRIEVGAWGEMPPAKTLAALGRKLAVQYTSVHNISYRKGLQGSQAFGDGLSSSDNAVRRRAVEATCRTVDIARTLGARYVVIHAGGVDVAKGHEKQRHAVELIKSGNAAGGLEYIRRCMAERAERAPRAVERAAASLSEVMRLSGDFPLAIESRIHYYSIPQPAELEFIMTVLAGRPLYYWHDVGHTRVGELLGLAPALMWLEAFGGVLAGIHLHDVRGFTDHRMPGTGDVDFRTFVPYMSKDTVKVLEIVPSFTPAEIRKGIAHLRKCGIA